MEDNFEDNIAPQILSEIKYSKSLHSVYNLDFVLEKSLNGGASRAGSAGNVAAASAPSAASPFLPSSATNSPPLLNGSLSTMGLLKSITSANSSNNIFGAIYNGSSSSPSSKNPSLDLPNCVPSSPYHSGSPSPSPFLRTSSSNFECVPVNEPVQITPFNKSENATTSTTAPNGQLYPPIPTIFATGKSLIPSPNTNLCSSTDSLNDSFMAYTSLSSSPSQSVPSSPPSFSKSQYKNQTIKHTNFVQKNNSIIINNNSNSNNNSTTINIQCTLNDCLLCQRGQPDVLIKSPTWASIMRVVFFTLHQEKKDKLFFSLKSDVYDFMTAHWDILCMNKKKSDNWHKQIQDMLSHSKNIFESGMDKYKQNGYWRLKQVVDPWVLPKQKGRKSTSSSRDISSATNSPSQSLSSSPSTSIAVPSTQTSPLILSNNRSSSFSSSTNYNNNSSQSPFNFGANAYPTPQSSPMKLNFHNMTPHQLSSSAPNQKISKLFYEQSNRKRSSIDMLISSSMNDFEMDPLSSPRKKRLADSGEVKNYSDDLEDDDVNSIDIDDDEDIHSNTDNSDDDDILFIDESNNNLE